MDSYEVYVCLWVCAERSPVMGIAEFLGVVSPGSKALWIEGINLHEQLCKYTDRETDLNHSSVLNFTIQCVYDCKGKRDTDSKQARENVYDNTSVSHFCINLSSISVLCMKSWINQEYNTFVQFCNISLILSDTKNSFCWLMLNKIVQIFLSLIKFTDFITLLYLCKCYITC